MKGWLFFLFSLMLAWLDILTAASISWEPALDSTAPHTVITKGRLVEAVNGTAFGGRVTVNGVDFTPSDTLLGNQAFGMALDNRSTLDPGLDSLLGNMDYGGGTSTTITVGSGKLVVGQTYLIQVFYTDLRPCCRGRVMTFGDHEGNTVEVGASGTPGSFGQSAIGLFTSDAASQVISLRTNGFGNAHLNGYQIRLAAELPVIGQFTVSPSWIPSGERSTLSWQVEGADSVVIDNGVGAVSVNGGIIELSPETTTTYTLTAVNGGGVVSAEVTVGVDVPVRTPLISEFLARNDANLVDQDGNDSDWIEIYNPNPFAIDLDGYFLSDDPSNLTRWAFPEGVRMEGESYLIVFASGAHRGLPELHGDFGISAEGGSLFLVAPDGATVVSSFFDYPVQRTNISYGAEGYFAIPTPGGRNGAATSGFVADTRFDVDRGFFNEPFVVDITTATLGATVVYTTDGSEPTLSNGVSSLDSASVPITKTTVLRASAFKAGMMPTNVDTQTYFFTSDIIRQPAMDAQVVDGEYYRDEIEAALKSIRSLSIVTDPDNLYGSASGLLANTGGRGRAWERPVSIEFIDPDFSEKSIQVDAGLRVHGNGSRSSPKNSLRLLFRADYGPKKLDYPLFGENWVAQKFNTVVLRAQNANSWTSTRAEDRAATTFLQDSFAKDSQGAMGHPTAGSTFVHLFLNGIYWGLYNLTERPDGSFGEDHFGGDDADYDAVNRRFSVEVLSGTKAHWDEMIAYTGNLLDSQVEYEAIAEFIDLDNLIDYMLLHQVMQTRDGPDDFGHNNMRLVRRNTSGGAWRAYAWDMEYSMIDPTGTRNYDYPFPIYSSARSGSRDITDSIASIYIRLKEHNPEFRLRYADRVNRHLFNGGALTPAEASARFEARAREIESAVVAESARWGDERRGIPYTRDVEWVAERNRINKVFFPARPNHVVSQLRRVGLYPGVDPPLFSRHGGEVPPGFELIFSAPTGTIYYTFDGSDPREAWTGAPVGAIYSSRLTLGESMTVKARTRLAGEWSALTEASFVVGTPARSGNLIVSEINYHPPVGQEGREFIELLNLSSETIELGRARFTEGIDFTFPPNTNLLPGRRIVIVRDRAAFAPSEQLVIAGVFENGTGLANGGERIAMVDFEGVPILDFTYGDRSPWTRLPDGGGPSLTLRRPDLSTDLSDPAQWRPSGMPGGSPGDADSTFFSGSAQSDDNGNGIPNLVEYALGAELLTGFVSIEGEWYATLTFTENVLADDVIVWVETSANLSDWAPEVKLFSWSYGGAGTATVTWRTVVPISPDHASCFLRVRVARR